MESTLNKRIQFLTKKGMKELKKSIHQLEHDKYKLSKALREIDKTTARDEKVYRSEILLQMSNVESEIIDKRIKLSNSRIMPSQQSRIRVAMGSVVDLIDKSGKLFRYKLVDSIEADPSDGRISVNSPLGQSLVGRTVKETVKWGRNGKFNQLKLMRIS